MWGMVAELCFQLAPAHVDQVVTHVAIGRQREFEPRIASIDRGATWLCSVCRLQRWLFPHMICDSLFRQSHGRARNIYLCGGGTCGEFLDLAAIAVTRVEIHVGIDTGRIFLESAVDYTYLFGELQPIVYIQLS